jgi:thiol-disulfide isomerase/thioredoxin
MIQQLMIKRTQQVLGKTALDFLPELGGRAGSLQEKLGGKSGALLVFWSGVCSHCARYDDFLNSFATRYPSVELLVIACRQEESQRQVHATAKKRGLHFPIMYDADRLVAHAWQVQQTPRVFLVDANSQLVYRGAIDNFKYAADPGYQPYLINAIDEFLSGRKISRAETPSFGCAIESVYYSLPKPMEQ